MSKSGEHFLAIRAEEAARLQDENRDAEYREWVYLRGMEKQPSQRDIKPKQDAHSTDQRTSK